MLVRTRRMKKLWKMVLNYMKVVLVQIKTLK